MRYGKRVRVELRSGLRLRLSRVLGLGLRKGVGNRGEQNAFIVRTGGCSSVHSSKQREAVWFYLTLECQVNCYSSKLRVPHCLTLLYDRGSNLFR